MQQWELVNKDGAERERRKTLQFIVACITK